MHHIYHTEGIILSSANVGETGKYYQIFTRDFGLIYASAQGVRKLQSKLRYTLQDFSYIKLDLVRTRDFWRITTCEKTGILEGISKRVGAMYVFANVARLLKRLLTGEEANTALFEDLLKGLLILEKTSSPAELRNVEVVIVLRILNILGYIGDTASMGNLAKSPFEESLVFEVAKKRRDILSEINKALRETQL